MKLTVVEPPAAEPVTVAEAKAHMQLYADQTQGDPYVAALIAAAREKCEVIAPVSFVTRTLKLSLPRFPGSDRPGFGRSLSVDASIKLLQPPVSAVASVSYIDPSGVLQTLDPSAYVLSPGIPASISPAVGATWPSTIHGRPDAVQIVYQAGYGDPSAVPAVAKLAVMQLAAHWFARREPIVAGTIVARVPFTVEAVLDSLDPGTYP